MQIFLATNTRIILDFNLRISGKIFLITVISEINNLKMNYKIKLIGILLFLYSCKEKSKPDFSAIDQELSELTSLGLRRDYLEKIYENDMKFRQGQAAEIMVKYGKNSAEYGSFLEKWNALDLENLYRVERYFLKFGYPSKDEFGEKAALTPWIVIHHSGSYEGKERNFGTIYQAFLIGDIDAAAMTLFLGRMHEEKYHERLSMENPYTAEEEINALIAKLHLEVKK